MINDPQRLREVIDEMQDWTLTKRREFIRQVGEAYGEESAEQIRNGLTALWNEKER